MLANYLKISIAVLLRRRFLTFVNLFGTALTLTILVVAFAVLDSRVSPDGAERGQKHVLVIDFLRLRGEFISIAGGVGRQFYESYVEPMQTPDKASFFTRPRAGTSYLDGRKIETDLRYTDAAYWDILEFRVLDGRTIAADDVDAGRAVAVINEATADTFFPGEPAVGQTLVVNFQSLEVIGVVANEPETSGLAYADIWIPLTAETVAASAWTSWVGEGVAMLYVEDPGTRNAVRDEYARRLESFATHAEGPDRFDTAVSEARTTLEIVASQLAGRASRLGVPASFGESGDGNVVIEFFGTAVVAGLLLMALPAINMVNLSVGRIMERASEIGLRKAAGASKRMLVGQFLFENVVLSAIGGALALIVSSLILSWLNGSVYAYGALKLNASVFLAGLAFIVIFGVVSGVYPAWKMARLEPAAALRGQQHA